MERTVKDRDIARMCALKAAVDITAAFADDVRAAEGNATEITLKAAEKFYRWIFQPAQGDDRIGSQIDENGDERANWQELVIKECHALQKKLGLKLTDFDTDPCPWGDWKNGGAAELLESLRQRGNGNGDANPEGNGNRRPKGSSKGLEKLAWDSGFEDRWRRGEPAAITVQQYGYAVSLHKKLGIDHDPEYLNGMTAQNASAMIDDLKAQLELQKHSR